MQTEQTDSSGDEAAAVDVHQLEDLLRAEAPDHAGVILVVGLPPALRQTPHDLLARQHKQGIWVLCGSYSKYLDVDVNIFIIFDQGAYFYLDFDLPVVPGHHPEVLHHALDGDQALLVALYLAKHFLWKLNEESVE